MSSCLDGVEYGFLHILLSASRLQFSGVLTHDVKELVPFLTVVMKKTLLRKITLQPCEPITTAGENYRTEGRRSQTQNPCLRHWIFPLSSPAGHRDHGTKNSIFQKEYHRYCLQVHSSRQSPKVKGNHNIQGN